MLIGIAIRLAQSIGIHRDGAYLKLSPFETEIRLRLWWQLCLLDSRAPEDHGFVHTIDHLNQGLRPPLNIDDDQLFPTMKALPVEPDSWTEMTFHLIQIETCRLLQQVVESRTANQEDVSSDLIAKRRKIADHKIWMESKFFSRPTPSRLQRIASIHYYSACSKMGFVLQLREQLHASGDNVSTRGSPGGSGKSCLLAAFRDIESSYPLLNGKESGNFAWLFRMYTKWYSLMYILRYLCAFPSSPEAVRGWDLVDRTVTILPYFQTLPAGDLSSKDIPGSSVWQCLALLHRQALNARSNFERLQDAEAIHRGSEDNFGPLRESERLHIDNMETELQLQPERDGQSGLKSVPSMVADNPSGQWYPTGPTVVDPTTIWQNGCFSFDDSTMAEMLYLPEWSDIVNKTLDLA